MQEKFDYIFNLLKEAEWWLQKVEPNPLADNNFVSSTDSDGILRWFEGSIDIKSDPFLSYKSRYDAILKNLLDVIGFNKEDYIYDNIKPDDCREHEYVFEILQALASDRFYRVPTIGNLLLTHHALVRTIDYLEIRRHADGLAYHLYKMASKRLFGDTPAYMMNTMSLLSFAENGSYLQDVLAIIQSLTKRHPLSTIWIKEKNEKQMTREQLNAGMKYADLAYGQPIDLDYPAEILHPYLINFRCSPKDRQKSNGFFHFERNMKGFVAYTDEESPRIILGFAGTNPLSLENWKTDIGQFFCGPNLPYLCAYGMLNSILMGKSHRKNFKDSIVEVYGHSLGGGMMQFAVANNNSDMIRGYGYNSAGLGVNTISAMEYWNISNISHLYQPMDAVFMLPHTYQLGKAVKVKGVPIPEPITAHVMATLKLRRGKHENETAWILG